MPAKNSVEKKAFIEIGKSQCYYRCCQIRLHVTFDAYLLYRFKMEILYI